MYLSLWLCFAVKEKWRIKVNIQVYHLNLWLHIAKYSETTVLVLWCGSRPAGSGVVVAKYKYTWTTETLWRKRDGAATLSRGECLWAFGHSFKRRATRPLPWQAFIVFLGPLHQRWSSFTRFVLGGYLLQTKERMSLNTSKKDICNVKGEVVKTGYAPYLEGLAQILGR